MPALPSTQQPEWKNDVYVLATTRVVVMIGLAYLIKSLYNLVPSLWGTRSESVATVVADGIELENIVSDTLAAVPGVAGAGLDLEVSQSLDIRPPQAIYDPQNHLERSWANVRAQHQSVETSGQPADALAMPEQEGDVNDGNRHIEGDMGNTVGIARRAMSIKSMADEEIGGTATQSPRDAVRSSLDA